MNAYQKYLQTKEWKAFRLFALKNANNKCEFCDSTENLAIHHKHYETLGNEEFEDVEVLCRRCHQLRENRSGFVTVDIDLIRKLRGNHLRLYLLIKADMFLNKQSFAELTYKTIAKLMGYSVEHVRQISNDLIAYNLVVKDGGNGRPNKYRLTPYEDWVLP